jgi:hypothetical protein
VAVACGANMNFDRLRFVAERAEIGEAREAVFAVTIPEQRGSFKRFCSLVGPRNVTEFIYRISDASEAHVFVGVQIGNRSESGMVARTFEEHGFRTLDLTHDELAKQHIRHLVGGKSPLAHDELLYRFEFPERPGALMRFLDSMAPNWNISLFHYRNQGGDVGRILVGLQVPAGRWRSSGSSWRRWATGIGTRPRIRFINCFCNIAVTRAFGGHGVSTMHAARPERCTIRRFAPTWTAAAPRDDTMTIPQTYRPSAKLRPTRASTRPSCCSRFRASKSARNSAWAAPCPSSASISGMPTNCPG